MVRFALALITLGVLCAASPHAQATQRTAATPEAQAIVVVNLNTATAAELQRLPGIGVRTAERIIEFRQKNGPFKKIEEIMNVQGIGEKTFLRLRPQLTVTAAASASQR